MAALVSRQFHYNKLCTKIDRQEFNTPQSIAKLHLHLWKLLAEFHTTLIKDGSVYTGKSKINTYILTVS